MIIVLFVGLCPFVGKAQQEDAIVRDKNCVLSRLMNIGEHGLDYLTFRSGRHSVVFFPVLGYSPVTKLEFGVMPVWRVKPDSTVSRNYYRPTSVAPSLLMSVTGMFEFEVDVETFTSNLWTAKFKTQFVYLPDKYYGMGNRLSDVEPIKYKAYRYRVEGYLMKGWREKYFYGLQVDAGYNEHRNREGMMIPADVTGFQGGWCNAIGPMLAYDTRNNSTWPTHGVYIKLSSLFSGRAIGSEYEFQQVSFDSRYFATPFSDKGVNATQFFLESGSGTIPFYKMPAIGGKLALRGISHPLKYTDRNAWFLQNEFRRHLWWRFGVVMFGGVGSVFHNYDKVFDDIYYSVGGGLRIQVLPGEKLNLRIDYGIANGGDHGLYLTIREAF